MMLERGGDARSYEGTLNPSFDELYHDLRRQKYGGAGQFIELFSGGEISCDAGRFGL